MFNFALIFVLLFQAGDPFAHLEKSLAKNLPALAQRDAAFAKLKTAVRGGNWVEMEKAYYQYLLSPDLTLIWLDLKTELDRVVKLVKDKSDKKTTERLVKVSAQVDAFLDNPPEYDQVIKEYRDQLADQYFGLQLPVVRSPK